MKSHIFADVEFQTAAAENRETDPFENFTSGSNQSCYLLHAKKLTEPHYLLVLEQYLYFDGRWFLVLKIGFSLLIVSSD